MSRCGHAWKAIRCSRSLRRSDTGPRGRRTRVGRPGVVVKPMAESRKPAARRRPQEAIRTPRVDVSIHDLRLTRGSYAKTENTQRRGKALSLDRVRQNQAWPFACASHSDNED